MSTRAKLLTTSDVMDRLHAAYDGVRANSATVKVQKADLWKLLQDHATLITIHRGKVDEL